ncbi:hypothetical protein NDN08_005857 [Rhodosorus marinus]|uniref:WHIM1 domain-containing protein n=1 Tax=Rhodosorus marinus TaxID=101924 RepID=A0AAV8V4F0_9RHOD|nr:hypothetical protein NDN08_005857 [Rhodosorus marinus]
MLISDYLEKKQDPVENNDGKGEAEVVKKRNIAKRPERKPLHPVLNELRSLVETSEVEHFLMTFPKALGLGAGGIDLVALENFLAQPEEFSQNRSLLDDVIIALLAPEGRRSAKEWRKSVLRRAAEKREYFDSAVFDGSEGRPVCVLEDTPFNELPVRQKILILKGLCDLATDDNEAIREAIKVHVKESTLEEGLVRLKPCWRTSHNRPYYFLDNGSPSCTSCRIFSVGKAGNTIRVESSDMEEFTELLERTVGGADKRAATHARKLRERKLEPLLVKVQQAERRKQREEKREVMRLEAIARWTNSERPRRSAAKVASYAEFDLREKNSRFETSPDRKRLRRGLRGDTDSQGSDPDEAADEESSGESPEGDSEDVGAENGRSASSSGSFENESSGSVETKQPESGSVGTTAMETSTRKGQDIAGEKVENNSNFSSLSESDEPEVDSSDDEEDGSEYNGSSGVESEDDHLSVGLVPEEDSCHETAGDESADENISQPSTTRKCRTKSRGTRTVLRAPRVVQNPVSPNKTPSPSLARKPGTDADRLSAECLDSFKCGRAPSNM